MLTLPPLGVIIAANIILVAGIALYESPQFRAWVDSSRRKIALALHSLGDDIQPGSRSESDPNSAQAAEERRKRREEIVQRNRAEIIRQAREEGIAVDLDVLSRIGQEELEKREKPALLSRADKSKSFDDIVAPDGKLRTTGVEMSERLSRTVLHRRSTRGSRGFARGASFANPFGDEAEISDEDNEMIRPEQDELSNSHMSHSSTLPADLAPSPFEGADAANDPDLALALRMSWEEERLRQEIARQAEAEEEHVNCLIDVSDNDASDVESIDSSHVSVSPSETRGEEQALRDEQELYASPSITGSFHSLASINSHTPELGQLEINDNTASAWARDDVWDDVPTPTGSPTGALTPTSDGFSTSASLAGSNADDIGVLSSFPNSVNNSAPPSVSGDYYYELDPTHVSQRMNNTLRPDGINYEPDDRSETLSDAGMSEFSEISRSDAQRSEGRRTGISTPGSWTDIGSEEGSQDGINGIGTV
ncbi:hypothetical protein M501DRAFT_995741 [Patellaria atrata CBS 101060]|uniref:Uncharacterized protein n=1 Tax=Patellaria atrata CBS 101060 TaxID=1346257 RepID=A0A9P4S8L4_9PEZI|nr:hypothetical protein M501DRAFT_995741 [Patellaria atrata CBS 101060]